MKTVWKSTLLWVLALGACAETAANPAATPSTAPQPAPEASASADKSDLIRVAGPLANTAVQSPLRVYGEARGNWFFEASFPITLLDDNGKVLVETHAQARGEWMTTAFVPFEAELQFEAPATPGGKLVLHKDNPSDLPEHNDQLELPVRFNTP